jgi:FtsP/CotA-like multicopper oxidase with cupredoxin domain
MIRKVEEKRAMEKRYFFVQLSLLLAITVCTLGVGQGASLAAQGNSLQAAWDLAAANRADQGKMQSTTPAKRQATRVAQGPQQKGVSANFAGIDSASAALSPLAPLSVLGAAAPHVAMHPLGTPDYFGVPNWANSPLPEICPATGTSIVTGGACTPGTIVSGTGMRKFVATDTLPNLHIAVPDITTFPGSDYYEISVKRYYQVMHADLATANGNKGTELVGYMQTNGPSPQATPSYMGPLIIARKNRPVRITFTNALPTANGGNLFIPTDITYMGAGMGPDGTSYSQNRVNLHLHGGNTPWISDGTPHQWTTPAGEPTSFPKGVSVGYVPDMWFNASGNLIVANPTCQGNTTCAVAGATNNPGPGKLTFYWTNQQSGRLMFYHDHAYGITRLNVYAGEAAGYQLFDPLEEAALKVATVPGTISKPDNLADPANDLSHNIPLVIQDKTFVPDNGAAGGQLAATDPTWSVTNWGGFGNLWFPHVYMPNQNPMDPSGSNGFGRWDYGPWFWPPMNPATLVGMPIPCPNNPSELCPGTPNPSGVPESFLDTPLVNGKAYPTLTVDPAAYRFHILNAANDRSFNLQLYVADPLTIGVVDPGAGYTATPAVTLSAGAATATTVVANGAVTAISVVSGAGYVTPPDVTIDPPTCIPLGTANCRTATAIASVNTEVKMLPASMPTEASALPLCSELTPVTSVNLGLGLATSTIYDGVTNITGLPASCWPVYSNDPGLPAPSMWPTDGREGGVPDPTNAGPPFIQIGTEGGLLPKVAVIPSTPIGYEYNRRSITVTNVSTHGLLMGPAERADTVVDFTPFAGKTLILYNDAPTPNPGFDPRTDYYTGNPDYSMTGGAPSTLPGYGPNTRTIMQINVSGSIAVPGSQTLDVAKLRTALPNIFSGTGLTPPGPNQPAPIIPANVFARIQDTSITTAPSPVLGLTLDAVGRGYLFAPSVFMLGGGGSGATATATLAPRPVGSLTLTSGSGASAAALYTAAPTVSFTLTSAGGSGATAKATLDKTGGVKSVAVTTRGTKYTSAPTVAITGAGGSGSGATATATVSNTAPTVGLVTAITVTNPGSGYKAPLTVALSGGGGSGARGSATLGYKVASVSLTKVGSSYNSAPMVNFTGGGGSGAAATSTLAPGPVAALTMTNGGLSYTTAPVAIIAGGGGTGALGTAIVGNSVPMLPKAIQELFTLDYGRMNSTLGVELPFTNFVTQTTIPYGFVDPPSELFKDGDTQVWKITHNGVDTHFMHFHLFNVQVINRVGWDGTIRPPDINELGWKETVRMNPLEDIIVALAPLKPTIPWDLPNSTRPLDVTQPVNYTSTISFTNVDPANQPVTVVNDLTNFGWEYVWHCHLLGHEESDMMRPMIMAVAPKAPSNLAAPATGTLTWTDNSLNETSFTIQRSPTNVVSWTTIATVPAAPGSGTKVTYKSTALIRNGYNYRVIANNLVGYTRVFAAPAVGYPTQSIDSLPSNVVLH